jgi:hypothetical protein
VQSHKHTQEKKWGTAKKRKEQKKRAAKTHNVKSRYEVGVEDNKATAENDTKPETKCELQHSLAR